MVPPGHGVHRCPLSLRACWPFLLKPLRFHNFRVDRRGRLLAAQDSHDVLGSELRHRGARLEAGAGDVRHDEAVFERQQTVIGW